jgi:hypothetical protein
MLDEWSCHSSFWVVFEPVLDDNPGVGVVAGLDIRFRTAILTRHECWLL